MSGPREQFVAIEHRSLQPDRLGNPAERVFLDEWQRINDDIPAGKLGMLEIILQPMWQKGRPPLFDKDLAAIRDASKVSQRDAEVAASVIQWLATAVGKAFRDRCEAAFKAAMHTRRQADEDFRELFDFQKRIASARERELADQIASKRLTPGTVEHKVLSDELTAAIRVAARSVRQRNPREYKRDPMAGRKIDVREFAKLKEPELLSERNHPDAKGGK